MQNYNVNVVILAAGKGTRMKSEKPKVLHRVCGLTLVERVMRASALEGVNRMVVVTGYAREKVEEEVKTVSVDLPCEVVCAYQEVQNGTGGAAQVAIPHLSPDCTHVLIVPGDSPLLKKRSVEPLFESEADVTLLTARLDDPHGFGRIVRDREGRVKRIVEQKDCTEEETDIREVNTSFYFVKKEVLALTLEKLSSDNAQKELYLTDIVEHANAMSLPVVAKLSSDPSDLAGANSVSELSRLETIRREEIIEEHMAAGVSFEHPGSVFIAEDVQIGSDTVVGPGVKLVGKTRIGSGVLLEGSSLINNSELGDNVLVRYGCYLNEAKVDSSVTLGPFAHLRPGSELAEGVKIGNFVETKKAKIHKGAKVNHLSYIGDAEVGEEANIGAGTITCNYDGFVKSKTTIGKGAFIGSNTALVAPVEVGDGAYVGAGSVITKDVPSDALGLTRPAQKVVEGYAKRKREK